MHRHTTTHQPAPTPEQLEALLTRAEHCMAAQRDAYGTELNEDRAWRCAWNTWRTLQDLTVAVRALHAAQPAVVVVPLRAQPTPELAPLGRTA